MLTRSVPAVGKGALHGPEVIPGVEMCIVLRLFIVRYTLNRMFISSGSHIEPLCGLNVTIPEEFTALYTVVG